MFKKPFHSFKLELHICASTVSHSLMPAHWFSMCNQCICEPKRWGDVTNVHAQKHFHVVPWTLGRLCMPWACRECEFTDHRNQNWSPEGTAFGNSVLLSQGGETVDLTPFFPPSFVLFCFLDYVFLCTPTKQMCHGVSTSLQTFAACLGS